MFRLLVTLIWVFICTLLIQPVIGSYSLWLPSIDSTLLAKILD